jgi:chromosome segregation protein
MINRLIEAKPEELRVYLEEAAGVSRYKERRRETENRLSDTRENLVRIDDILRELTAQLEKLETQAEVAREYRSLQADGEAKQNALWYLKEAAALQERTGTQQAIDLAQTELEASTAGLRASEAALESRRQAHYAAGDAVHAAQGAMYEANAKVSSLEAEIRHVVESRNRVQSRRAQLQGQMTEWEAQQEHCQEQILDSEEELMTSAARAEQAREQAHAAQAGLPDIEAHVRQAGAEREDMRSALARVEQNLALAAQSQRDSDRQLQVLELRRERLTQELKGVDVPDLSLLERLAGDKIASEELLEESQGVLIELEDRLPEVDARRSLAQREAQVQSETLARLEARYSALVRLQEDVQKKGALEPWLVKHELTTMSRLWQKLHVEAGWETALEAVLNERMTGLEVRSLDWARAFASDPPPARLAFFQLPVAAPAAPAPAGLTPLSSLLRISDPDLRTLLQGWLGNVYIATDVAQALAARATLPPGAMFVVQGGHLVEANSVRFYAADSEQAGLLARQQEIENLQREIKANQLISDQTRSAVAQAESAFQQVSQSLPPARQRMAEITRRLHDLQLEYTRVSQQVEQVRERSGRLEQDIAEVASQQEELLATKLEAEARFEELDGELAVQQEIYATAEIAGEALAAEAESARARLRDQERGAQEAEFAERGMRARIAELQRNLQLAVEQITRARQELIGLESDLSTLDAEAAQAGLQEALELRASCEEMLSLARIEMDTLAAQLRQADEERLVLERSLEPRRERIMQLQLQEQAARLASEQFAEQLDARQVDRVAVQAALVDQPEQWSRPPWLQTEVQRITRQIESLGSVNLAALDELNASRERRGYLDAQYNDLQSAIETLEDAIRRIDRETRDLLQTTFTEVNMHFGELFPKLFGGGEARLIMTGDEILDAGVQVMAQPPGKRNTSIHLLSGGEKALTATALVFALFKLNPAPFCLLDEVDAPLDDANTERYANLVSSMSEHTQFLFISHNKIAMQMARQLVGVTMQEQGVSRIVAVDIESALQLAAEAA